MDFTKFDARTAAETPRKYVVRMQHTGEEIADPKTGKPAIVLIRGAASRTAQQAIRDAQRARMKAKAVKGAKTADDEVRALEDLHETLITAAARYIVGFEGIERRDSAGTLRPAEGTDEDVRWFLDLNMPSLPHLMRASQPLEQRENESDEAFEARREAHAAEWLKPSFAQQIIDAAQEDEAFLGGMSTA